MNTTFKDNADPNFDFGVWVKITIKPLKFSVNIEGSRNPASIELKPSIFKAENCKKILPEDSIKVLNLSCDETSGTRSASCKVRFKLELGEKNGGHYINSGRPLGQLIDATGNKTLDEGTYYNIPVQGLIVNYLAPEVSGEVKISFDVRDSHENEITSLPTIFAIRSAQRFEKIEIEGLNFVIKSRKNQDGYYGTKGFISKLKDMINLYKEYGHLYEVPQNKLKNLESEAASLSWGGLFDIDNNWKPSHCGHRNGKAIDLSMTDIKNSYPAGKENEVLYVLQWAMEDAELLAPVPKEKPGDFNNHWHLISN